MPEKDGLAALKEIIELDPAARVIMCSALGQESKVLESIKLGAKDFVVKPFQARPRPRGGRQGARLAERKMIVVVRPRLHDARRAA